MKPKRTLKATTLDTGALAQASGGRGTLCGNVMHCSGCGYAWGANSSGSYGVACPACGLGINSDTSGGGGGGGGGGGTCFTAKTCNVAC